MKIGEDEFTVKYSYFGLEQYFLNGELIRKSWVFRWSGSRVFDIKGNRLVIEASVKPMNYYCKAFLNGELYVEELFPEFKDRIDRQRGLPTLMEVVGFILAMSLIVAALALYRATR